jgi:hypothetical protein
MEKSKRLELLDEWYKVPIDIRRNLLYTYNSTLVGEYIRDTDSYNEENLTVLLELFKKIYCNVKICNTHGVLKEVIVEKKTIIKKNVSYLLDDGSSTLTRNMIHNVIINVF